MIMRGEFALPVSLTARSVILFSLLLSPMLVLKNPSGKTSIQFDLSMNLWWCCTHAHTTEM